uniref:TBC1 domain family member 23 n=1 Tax=Strigamia maritima TaxID=126957 RepID=T1IWL1_STRMM
MTSLPKMADAEEENGWELETSWTSELHDALDEYPDSEPAMETPENQTRTHLWQDYLDVKEAGKPLIFDEIFDLPEQNQLRNDCQQLVEKLGNEEEDKVSVVSDLELVLTCYCKKFDLKYESNNGWIEILAPLLALKLSRDKLYKCFHAIRSKFTPRDISDVEELLRLLILYHDPELCSILDSKKVLASTFCTNWFRSLFASVCNLKVTQCMWDVYFRLRDSYLIFFLALVILINAKDQIIASNNKETIISLLNQAPTSLEADDVQDFCSLAQFYASRTPQSFRKDYSHLFENQLLDANRDDDLRNQSLCLPVSMEELLQLELGKVSGLRFFVVDCRPADQYNSGHLATAFHLDASLMLQEPQAFATATEELLRTQQESLAAGSVAAGEHLCFLGSGREDEDQFVYMVVASFLQKHTQHVSWARGGYLVLHEFTKKNLGMVLADHSIRGCIACNLITQSEIGEDGDNPKNTIFTRLASAVKTRAAEVNQKLVDYIQNPHAYQPVDRHVSSKDKLGKRYRNMESVFTIDDDQDGDTDNASLGENQSVVSINTWLKKPEIINAFQCHHISDSGFAYLSHLAVTKTHFYVLRELEDKSDSARIVLERDLSYIVKITSKRKQPELLTFRYGVPNDDTYTINDVDRFFIPKAGDAAKLIKQQICNQHIPA